ncbi:hypothetical protein C2845_PM07G19060 [Panicum miliaceum]|uniref:Uncharacterized protein n=1 Tax=Panicum miliaceum TaxID=4540 RepID=A0A3L6SHE1_PANMI|nr:hypothetical protein C2845_PM07G19060 [Panicum miliaceum]
MSNITSSTPRMRHLQPLNTREDDQENWNKNKQERKVKATFQDRSADNNKAKDTLRYLAKRERHVYISDHDASIPHARAHTLTPAASMLRARAHSSRSEAAEWRCESSPPSRSPAGLAYL